MATVIAEKKNGPAKIDDSKKVVATAKKSDGEKKPSTTGNPRGGDRENGEPRTRNRRRKQEGETRRTKEGDDEKKEKKPAPEKKEHNDAEKPERKRRRRGGANKEDGEKADEKKPAAEKKEGDDAAKPKRKRNRRRGAKKEDGDNSEEDTEKKEGGESRSRRRRDRRKRAGPKDKAGVTAEMSEEELAALSCVRVNNFPHFLSYNDSGKYFRAIVPLLSEGMQLSYEILSEEEATALGEPATSKKEGEEKSNNRRELAYKNRFDYWTSPERAVKRRTVYLYPSTPGTIDELVKKLNDTKSLEFAVSDRLKEIPQFKHTEETSTVDLPRALVADKITWAEIPQYVQKPTSKPE